MILDLPNEAATAALGAHLAGVLRRGDCVCLQGVIGSGKSSLARAILRRLGVEEDAPSPTFTLVQAYEADGQEIWHFDLYRLKSPDEVLELGWEEAIPHAITLIEWPDQAGPWLPRDRLDITLTVHGDGRRAELVGRGEWEGRIRSLQGPR